MKFAKLFVLTAMTAVVTAAGAQAQGLINCGGSGEAALSGPSACIVTNTVSATVPTVARLEITTTTTTLNAPLAADFNNAAGVTSGGPTLTVRSNNTYSLTASANTPFWSGGAGNKPSSDLKMKVGAGSFVALGSVDAAGVKTAGTNYVIGYNTIYNWLVDVPGTFSLQVDYTLTAP